MLFNRFLRKNRPVLDSLKICIRLSYRNMSKSIDAASTNSKRGDTDCLPQTTVTQPTPSDDAFVFHNDWPDEIKADFLRDMRLFERFLSVDEEQSLMAEVEQVIQRMRYEYDHWDDAIHGYRETERKNWYPQNRLVLDRVGKFAFDSEVMPYVHILDLARDGIIKPHVDSSRYCGNIIAGLSLLTDCIMRLRRVDEKKYYQGKNANEIQVKANDEATNEFGYYVDVLLQQRSLYIMRDSARYKFTHEVLAPGAEFKGAAIEKDRRVSIICRNDS